MSFEDLFGEILTEIEHKKMYKLGVLVQSKRNGETYYVVGLKIKNNLKQLIICKEKEVPSRLGFPVYLDQMKFVEGL